MIKIIKDGQKVFTNKCDTCGCEFSYEKEDIALGSVMCPCCGFYVIHKIKTPWGKFTDVRKIQNN